MEYKILIEYFIWKTESRARARDRSLRSDNAGIKKYLLKIFFPQTAPPHTSRQQREKEKKLRAKKKKRNARLSKALPLGVFINNLPIRVHIPDAELDGTTRRNPIGQLPGKSAHNIPHRCETNVADLRKNLTTEIGTSIDTSLPSSDRGSIIRVAGSGAKRSMTPTAHFRVPIDLFNLYSVFILCFGYLMN